jgi:HEPN domain-containing protein
MTEPESSQTTPDPAIPPAMLAEGWERTLTQMFELYFTPELERRRATGTLPDNFAILVAQVLLPPDGPADVRFNNEVRGHGVLRAPRELRKGAPILVEDFQHLALYDLPDELLDNGHFTAFNTGETGWRMFFNFLSGRAKAADALHNARHFHDAAARSAEQGHAGPAVENLFTAAELASKAELILMRDDAANHKSHGSVASRINQWSRSGNIDAAFVSVFNKLSRQRPNARYGDAKSRPPLPTLDDLDVVAAMIERGLERTERQTDYLNKAPSSGDSSAS